MIRSLLIANRGEIARRIIGTCRRMGVRTVAVFSEADAPARYVEEADTAVHIGPAAASESYLNIEAIVAAARRAGVDAVHPGYGFLAENAAFARACEAAGLVFVGPPADAIDAMGDKRAARALAAGCDVPVVPGYEGEEQSDAAFAVAAARLGYPIMVKAAAGGGGKGMRLVRMADDLREALAAARREAMAAFGSDAMLLERALICPRHIEIQVLGDQYSRIVYLGERECSIQRRHQKVIEETPSVAVSEALRAAMGAAAVHLAEAIGYTGAGTVEFLLDEDGQFYFLEMNTRLQVEHPVTELVTGLDLVEWQIRIAEGERLPWAQEELMPTGHAIEARLYAEDPIDDFLPAPGVVLLWRPPGGEGVRVDDGIRDGDLVTTHYDPLLAKIIAYGRDRRDALRRLSRALETTTLLGVKTNLAHLHAVVNHPVFAAGRLHTSFLDRHAASLSAKTDDPTRYLGIMAAALGQWQRLPPDRRRHWRNNPSAGVRYRYRVAGETVDVELIPDARHSDRFELRLLPGPEKASVVQFVTSGEHEMSLTIDGIRRRVCLADRADTWWVQMDAVTICLETLPLLPEPHRRADAGGTLRAPLPAKVVAVVVTAGQAVTEGQPLMKLEAMKMEYTVRAPAAGVVSAVYYAVGDTVEADALLLSVEVS